MKIGDKVRRLPEYQHSYYKWSLGDAVCTVTDLCSYDSSCKLSHNRESVGMWDIWKFEIVDEAPDYLQQLKDAQSFVGQKMFYLDNVIVLDHVKLVTKGAESSYLVEVYLKDHDFCVVATMSNGYAIPFEKLTPITHKELRVGDYDAKIYADKVEVGCQTIPLSVVEEIVKQAKSLT
jgi:hypothetical protein